MSIEPFDQPAGIGDRLDDLLLRAENWLAGSRTAVVASVLLVLVIAAIWWSLASSPSPGPIEGSIPLADPGTGPSLPPPPTEGVDDATTTADPAGPMASGQGPSATSTGAEQIEEVVVHVVGAVRSPGLVTLAPGDRISDAVAAAGGGGPDADLARLNLASPVIDGMQIRVPATDEGTTTDQPLVQLPNGGRAPATAGGSVDPGPVDLNRAAEPELQTLPGIGPALAARIVRWRDENGGFSTVDDLEAVPGIGPAKLADLRDLVVV